MLLSAMSVLVVAHLSSEIPEGLMNNPVYHDARSHERQISLFIPFHAVVFIMFQYRPSTQTKHDTLM